MSFSSETKASSSQMPKHDDECVAMLYGMLMFSHSFSENEISFRTETAEVSDILCGLLLGVLDIMATPKMSKKGGGVIYKIAVTDKFDLEKIRSNFAAYGYSKTDRSLLTLPRDEVAFLRGAFLSCGYLNSPDKPYRLEFTVRDPDLAVELALILSRQINVMPKLSVRKTNQIVYYRESNLIVDFLNLIGQSAAAFVILNSQIERDIRNNINRQNNFDIANIGKKTEASMAQTEAIEWLISSGEFEKLPIGLKTTAKLRLDHPDASLEAIGGMSDPPISKSQVSKRLSQIIETYKSKSKG
ncbi:MAG: DNA-binding protein WhiA [Clostridia bacterium]|nr:DNA-binding protein WhiA [Clostridia bacterium]